MNRVLGIDIGGTKISYALIDNNGNIHSEIEKQETPKTAKEIELTLKNIIEKFEDTAEFTALATAGTVNNENNKVIGSTANLPFGYKEIDFQSLSSKRVFIENDANCASWAEYRLGASKGTKNSILLTLGTGVGGGIIVNGKLLKGKNGTAGEMHFPLSRKKERKCTCGNYDCFESYASGNGLKQTAIELFNDNNITTYDVIEKAQNNNELAKKALEIWQNDIAIGIIGLSNLFDPECVVLSGSMEKFVNVEEVEKMVNEKLVVTPIKIYHAKAKNNAGMIGAVLLGNELIY